MYVLAFAALGIILLVGVGAVFAFGGGGGSNASSRLIENRSCTEEEFKGLPPAHLDNPDAPVKYNSFPPSSGRHFFTPAIYDFYTEPVSETAVVHNLEHGAMVVQWGSKVPKSEVAKIREWWKNDARGLVAAPLPALGNKIAVIAWTHVAKCTRFDDGAFTKFRDRYQFKGPERIPPEAMDPGSS